MYQYEVHELSKYLLRTDIFLLAVANESHHHIQRVLIFYLHLQSLVLDLLYNNLLAVVLEQYPTQCHEWYKDQKVHNIVVALVSQSLADYTDEEYQRNCEILSFDE